MIENLPAAENSATGRLCYVYISHRISVNRGRQ